MMSELSAYLLETFVLRIFGSFMESHTARGIFYMMYDFPCIRSYSVSLLCLDGAFGRMVNAGGLLALGGGIAYIVGTRIHE